MRSDSMYIRDVLRVTWLNTFMWRESFLDTNGCIHMWHGTFICDVTELIYVRHETFLHATWLTPLWHNSIICDTTQHIHVTWVISRYKMSHPYVTWHIHMWRGSTHLCETWDIPPYDMTHCKMWHDWVSCGLLSYAYIHTVMNHKLSLCADSCIYAVWPIAIRIHSYCTEPQTVTNCVMWLLYLSEMRCDMTESRVTCWHAHMYIHVYVCIVCIYVCMYVYIHICIYVCAHEHIHIHFIWVFYTSFSTNIQTHTHLPLDASLTDSVPENRFQECLVTSGGGKGVPEKIVLIPAKKRVFAFRRLLPLGARTHIVKKHCGLPAAQLSSHFPPTRRRLYVTISSVGLCVPPAPAPLLKALLRSFPALAACCRLFTWEIAKGRGCGGERDREACTN